MLNYEYQFVSEKYITTKFFNLGELYDTICLKLAVVSSCFYL